jgi:hypothetical protein
MKRVLILTPRPGDGAALRDLLADAGHEIQLAHDLLSVADRDCHADVIVADLEPWTWEGRALIEGRPAARGAPGLIMLSTRERESQPSPGVRFLRKPIVLRDLESAITGEGLTRSEEAA